MCVVVGCVNKPSWRASDLVFRSAHGQTAKANTEHTRSVWEEICLLPPLGKQERMRQQVILGLWPSLLCHTCCCCSCCSCSCTAAQTPAAQSGFQIHVQLGPAVLLTHLLHTRRQILHTSTHIQTKQNWIWFNIVLIQMCCWLSSDNVWYS